MKKLFTITVILLGVKNSIAQTPLPVKEQYDYTHSKALFNGTHTGILNYIESGNPLNEYEYGEQLGFVLESYINMYKTTGDKAYLVKFINEALIIMSWRNTDFRFTTGEGVFYMNGILLWPMAHFSYLVLYEYSDLKNIVIPNSVLSIPTSTFSPNILPSQSSYTYGYIADWLVQKQVETFTVINASHWMDDDKGFKKTQSDDFPAEINWQSGFGAALLYLGFISSNVPGYSGLASYLDKGAAIARLYKSDIDIEDHCTGIPCTPMTYNHPLLRTTSDNSYWWYHSGWRISERGCGFLNPCSIFGQQPDYFGYTQYIEDISHGVTTLILPQVAYELNLFTHNNYPFSSAEMVRFKNMFTKNIFDGNLTTPGFHNAVNGADAPVYECDTCNPYGVPFNNFKYTSLAYMPFYKFDDGDGASVYDIVSNFFTNEIHPSPASLNGGLDFNGVAQTVSAQWDKECVDLTLYNRKMIYDQDFIVKNNLVVAPQSTDSYHQPGDNSFAEPIINSDEFIIEPGVTVNMVAGEEITFKTGFHAKAGSEFHAYIDPSACTDGRSVGRFSNNQTNEENQLPENKYSKISEDTAASNAFIRKHQAEISKQFKETNSAIANNSLTVYPNPFNTTTLISFYLDKKSIITLKIINQFGQEVFNELTNTISEQGNHTIEFDGSGLSKGIYYCILNIDSRNVQTKKIVLFK